MFDKKTLFILLVIAICFWFTTNYGNSRNSGPGAHVAMGTEESSQGIEQADHQIVDQDILDAQLLLINQQNKIEQSKAEPTDSSTPSPNSSSTKAPDVIIDSDQATLITEDKVKLGVIKELVLKVFPESSEEDIKIWQEELADTAPETALGILQLRKKSNISLFNLPNLSKEGLELPPLPIDQDSLPDPSEHSEQNLEDVFPESPQLNKRLEPKLTELQPVWKTAQSVCFENLKNMFSPGYKRLCLKSHAAGPLYPEPLNGENAGPLAYTQLDMKQGEIRETGKPFDFAIEGDGFFGVTDSQEGTLYYSRNGQFTLNEERHLCLKAGGTCYPLSPTIHIPPSPESLHLLANGTLIVHTSEGVAETIGELALYQFASPENLKMAQNGLLTQTELSGEGVAFDISSRQEAQVLQGCLEMSNVESDQELELLRQYKQQWQAMNEAAAIIESP